MATFRLSSGTSSTTPASFVPVVSDYTVVYVYAIGNTNTAPTCSDDNGGTYTLITAQLLNASASVLSLFVRDQPFSNTTATTITPSVGAATSWRATIESYSGMQRSGFSGVRQFAVQANQVSGTTPAPTFSAAALTANPTLGGVADATTLTAPASWTSQASGGKLQVVTRDSGFTGTTITWGSTDAAAYASIIVELDASAPTFALTQSSDPALRPRLIPAAMQALALSPKPGPELTPSPAITTSAAEFADRAPGLPVTHHRAPFFAIPTLANLTVPPNVAEIGEFPESAPGRPITHHRAPFSSRVEAWPILFDPKGQAYFPDRAPGLPVTPHRAPDEAQRTIGYPVPFDIDKPGDAEFPDIVRGLPVTDHRAPSIARPEVWPIPFDPRGQAVFPDVVRGLPVTHHRVPPPSIYPLPVIDKPYGANLTSAGGFYTTGASSIWSLAGDGYLEFAVSNAYPTIAVGLSTTDPDTNYATIGWAMITNSAGGFIAFYELGVFKTQATPNANTSLLRIQRNGTTITYYIDNALIYTSLATTSAPLFIDVGFNGAGTFTSIRLNDNGRDVPVRWTKTIGVTAVDSFESVGEALTPSAAVFPDRAIGRPVVHHRAPHAASLPDVFPIPFDPRGQSLFPDIARGLPITNRYAQVLAFDVLPRPLEETKWSPDFPDFARGLPITNRFAQVLALDAVPRPDPPKWFAPVFVDAARGQPVTHFRAPFVASNISPIVNPALPTGVAALSKFPERVPGLPIIHHRIPSFVTSTTPFAAAPPIAATLTAFPSTIGVALPRHWMQSFSMNYVPIPSVPPAIAAELAEFPDRAPGAPVTHHRAQMVARPDAVPPPNPIIPPVTPAITRVLVFELEDGSQTVYSWNTDVLPIRKGTEQRIANASTPRETYTMVVETTAAGVAYLQSQLAVDAAAASTFGIALAYESLLLTTVVAGTTIPVTDTSLSDWMYPGSQCVVVALDGSTSPVLVVQSFTSNTVVVDQAIGAAGSNGARVMPVVPALLDPQQQIGSYAVNGGRLQITARAVHFGGQVGEWAPRGATITMFDGRPVADVGVDVVDTVARSPIFGSEIVDNGAGAIVNVAAWPVAAWTRVLRRVIANDVERQWLKAFVGMLVGKQGVFLLPTYTADLTPLSYTPGVLTVAGPPTANAPNYVGVWSTSAAHRWLMVTMTDRSFAYARVDLAVDNHDGTQTLTLSTAPTGTVAMVSLMEQCRLDVDAVPISWGAGMGNIDIAARVVQQ